MRCSTQDGSRLSGFRRGADTTPAAAAAAAAAACFGRAAMQG